MPVPSVGKGPAFLASITTLNPPPTMSLHAPNSLLEQVQLNWGTDRWGRGGASAEHSSGLTTGSQVLPNGCAETTALATAGHLAATYCHSRPDPQMPEAQAPASAGQGSWDGCPV